MLLCPLLFFQTLFSLHSSQGFRCDSFDPSSHRSPTSTFRYVIYTDKRFQHSSNPHLLPRPRLSVSRSPQKPGSAAVNGEEGAGDCGDVKAEEGGGAREPGNVGQGGWRGSGLGGCQPQRAAASALGNIVFSWLVAQDMHSGLAPPPAERLPSCPKARDSWREG